MRLPLVERLEVVPDLVVIVARHLLARDRVLHHLAVLPDDPEVHEARRHLPGPAREVRVVALFPPASRLALDADIEGAGPEPRRRVALRHGAPSLAGQEPFALPEVLVLGAVAALAAAPSAVTPPCASLALTAAAQPLPRALRLLHRTHLVERALHGLEGPVRLPPLGRLHPLARVPTPVAALAPEALHLVEQLAQLLGRDVRRKPAQQRLGLFEDHLVLDRKSTRLNSSHLVISYAVFCLKKKTYAVSA